jgi:hypothetical protein
MASGDQADEPGWSLTESGNGSCDSPKRLQQDVEGVVPLPACLCPAGARVRSHPKKASPFLLLHLRQRKLVGA